MKIIRPIEVTQENTTSNAPPDPYAVWAPIGREFSEDWDEFIFDVVGSTLVLQRVVGSGNSSQAKDVVRVFDLATGDSIVTLADEDLNVANSVAISPDEQKVLFDDDNSIRVFDLTTGALVRSTSRFNVLQGYKEMQRAAWRDANTIVFCDEELFFTPRRTELRLKSLTVDTGVVTELANLYTVMQQAPVRTGGAALPNEDRGQALVGFVLTAGAFVGVLQVDNFDATSDGRAFAVVRVDLSTYAGSYYWLQSAFLENYDTKGFRFGVNASRGEVIIYQALQGGRKVIVLEDTANLGDGSVNPFSPAYDGLVVSAINSDATAGELCVSKTTGTRHNRFIDSSYASNGSLDSVIGQAPGGVKYSTNYYVYRKATGGYGLVELTDDTLVTQTNPSVTEGDIYTYGEHNYEALVDNDDRPDLGVIKLNENGDPAPTWLDLGFINPLRMFDNKLDSRTTGPSPLVIDITPNMLVNGLALFNVDAATVQITYTDPDDGLVYDTGQISMLDNSGVQDWYSFFFDPYLVKADLARVDLPAYIDGTVQITLDGAGADVAIGEIVLGTIYQIGEAQYGSSAGIIDFSRKEQDQFGNFEIVPRRFSKRAEFDAVIPPAYGGSVQRTLARLRATPIVWIGSVDLEETIVYGYFREFDILLSNPAFSNVTITVEGL